MVGSVQEAEREGIPNAGAFQEGFKGAGKQRDLEPLVTQLFPLSLQVGSFLPSFSLISPSTHNAVSETIHKIL